MKRIIISAFFILSFILNATSQVVAYKEVKVSVNDKDYNYDDSKFALAFTPQYMAANGIRIDFDYRIKDSTGILTLAPQYFFDKDYSDDNYNNWKSNNYDYKKVRGVGLNLEYRRFLSRKNNLQSFIGFGGVYQFYNIDYETSGWNEVEIDNLTYFESKPIEVNQKVHRVGGDIFIGARINTTIRIFIEGSIGIGARAAFIDSNNKDNEKEFNRYPWDFTNEGVLFIGMFRIGAYL